MEFTQRITLLKVIDRTFTNQQTGNDVAYYKATCILPSGDIIALSTTKEVYNDVADTVNVTGEATFTIAPDFKQNPKLKLVKFQEE